MLPPGVQGIIDAVNGQGLLFVPAAAVLLEYVISMVLGKGTPGIGRLTLLSETTTFAAAGTLFVASATTRSVAYTKLGTTGVGLAVVAYFTIVPVLLRVGDFLERRMPARPAGSVPWQVALRRVGISTAGGALLFAAGYFFLTAVYLAQ